MAGHNGSSPRDLLSPESGSLVRQLEVRIKELKAWLRDTELFIFNSCLRREKEGTTKAEKQLQYFQTLCCEIKQRRRGVASILRLCQHLLDDRETCNVSADHQPMQLIIVNLERRWEAIVMQAVQWQTQLQKKLGKESETLNVIDPGLMDLNGTTEDALEWDETDISHKLISLNEESTDLDQEHPAGRPTLDLDETGGEDPGYEEEAGDLGGPHYASSITAPSSPHIYQVYSLHNVELSEDSHMPFLNSRPKLTSVTQPVALTKSLSKDSSFSSTKSLPDLLGGASLAKPCPCHEGDMSQNSGSESGIVSEGDTETTTNSDMCLRHTADGSPSPPDAEPLDSHTGEAVDVVKPKHQDEGEHVQPSLSPVGCVSGKVGDFSSVSKRPPDCLGEELQGKHDVLTFYDYSYLQGSKLKLPMIMKPSQSEKAHVDEPLLHGFYFDKKSSKYKPQAAELQPAALPHERLLASASQEMDHSSHKSGDGDKAFPSMQNARQFPLVPHSASIESLSPSGDLFGLGIFKNVSDSLQRSTSLESWLTSYKSNEDLFSCHSSGDLSASSGSVGELSKRTLDLLNRLENIQSPSEQKIKRSVSDTTLQSSSQKAPFPGQLSLDMASSINEDSAASLTELSSSDELSLCSEDIVLHKSKVPESNASFRKRLPRSVADESDVNVSMIVNVSCTSACTDDEDDSDLLSSSTLTLTEEEVCGKDDEEDSSLATDDEIYEDCSLMSGLDYIKNELQTWIRPKLSLAREKRRCAPGDEIRSTEDVSSSELTNPPDTLSIEALLNDSLKCLSENNGNDSNVPHTDETGTKAENQKNSFQVTKDPHMADMENGNFESVPGRQVDKAGGVAKESAGLGSAGQRAEGELCPCKADLGRSDESNAAGRERVPHNVKRHPKKCRPCDQHSVTSLSPEKWSPALPSEARVTDREAAEVLTSSSADPSPVGGHAASCRRGLEGSETEGGAPLCGNTACCSCEPEASHQKDAAECSVHHFVKEIIDMASTALKSKSQPENEAAAPTSFAQIKEKVLEHSHRPIQLRKGDFYSYLSLSSHDSDCGELTNYVDEKSITPLPPDAADSGVDDKEDIECFFEACVEDDPDGEEPGVPTTPLTGPAVPGDTAGSLQATALSRPPPQKGTSVGKEGDGPSQTSSACEVLSELTARSGPGSTKASPGDPGDSGTAGRSASATPGTAGLSPTAKQPEQKAARPPSPQTLACEEALLNLPEEPRRNMPR
ncbi:A-kinase anchor protein 6 [Tenrec ecaudatus]|uniref:A-kinase anchor protein 6 n=1 Tax=Tenrec ecaudatus TaxID=94439 RepID=UPI003F596172